MQDKLEQICEKLQSNERRPKITALEQLQTLCDEQNADEMLSIFDDSYLHLLKCYADRYESVRDRAVHTVSHCIERLPPNDFHLLNIVATLTARLGQTETLEESEEIRLLLVAQLHALITLYVRTGNAATLRQCYADVVRVLAKVLHDAYPAVQREACACVVELAQSAETLHFQRWCEPLAKALYGMLNHKHSMARVDALQALGRVALHTDAGGEALSRLLMEVSPLLMDSMPLVRRQCGLLGVLLLLELRDRYSYFERIMPLVLCCLKDDSPEVVEHITPLWLQCGKLYYDENEKELNQQALADVLPPNYPSGVRRPSIGCRGLVQRSLRLLQLITRESSDWKPNVRIHSLKLLYQFVLHAEAAMTAKFFEIYPDVARACRDDDAHVVAEASKVADLMGRLMDYGDWYAHAYDGLEKNAREGYLKCFYYMYNATAATRHEDVLQIATLLATPDFAQTLRPQMQLYVLKLLDALLAKSSAVEGGGDADGQSQLMRLVYVAAIKVMALSYESEVNNAAAQSQLGNEILAAVAQRHNSSVAALHEQFFAAALSDVRDLDVALDELSEPILLLHGLVSICQFRSTYLAALQAHINQVLEHGADSAKVKIMSAVSIAMLSWHATIDRPLVESTELLRDFLVAVIEPQLLWRAGANAEAMRTLATATLCSLSQGAAAEATRVLPMCAKYMTSLLEDHATATRHYAVRCMHNFGALRIDELKPIAYGVLQRMDDPSAGIRELAVLALPKMQLQLTPKPAKEAAAETQDANDTFDPELTIWVTFVRKALDMCFLHYDGPELRLKQAIKSTLLELCAKYPDIAQESYTRTINMSYNSSALQQLHSELPFNVEGNEVQKL